MIWLIIYLIFLIFFFIGNYFYNLHFETDVKFPIKVIIVILLWSSLMIIELFLLKKDSKYVSKFAVVVGFSWAISGLLGFFFSIFTVNLAIKYDALKKLNIENYNEFKQCEKRYLKTSKGHLFYDVAVIVEVIIFICLYFSKFRAFGVLGLVFILETIRGFIHNTKVSEFYKAEKLNVG